MNQIDLSRQAVGWLLLTVGIAGIVYAPFIKRSGKACIISLIGVALLAVGWNIIA